jgi:hypothetical protein
MHPYCALKAKWTMVVSKASGIGSRMFCPKHSSGVNETNDVRVISLAKRNPDSPSGRPKKIQRRIAKTTLDSKNDGNEEQEKREKIQRRRDVLARFVLEEADIASDQDMDGDSAEEAEARRIEDEEGLSQDSFINDNVDLTQHFSQDELGEVDPDAADGQVDYSHRALDAQRALQNQFSTPLFNRRMRGQGHEESSVPSSQRGLGQMHFIRSVLEHHRQGGDAEEIEQLYHQLEQEDGASPAASSAADWTVASQNREASNTATRPQIPSNGAGTSLTAEQLARIEANRQEALRRRAQRQQSGVQN